MSLNCKFTSSFVNEFDCLIKEHLSNFIYLPTIDYSEKYDIKQDAAIYIASEIYKMEQGRKHEQEFVQHITTFYNYLEKECEKEIANILPFTDQYPQIVKGLVVLYFGNKENKSVASYYINNMIKKCIKIMLSTDIYGLVRIFVGTNRESYKELDMHTREAVHSFIKSEKQPNVPYPYQKTILTIVDAEELASSLKNIFGNVANESSKTKLEKRLQDKVSVEEKQIQEDIIVVEETVPTEINVARPTSEDSEKEEEINKKLLIELAMGFGELVKDINEVLNVQQLSRIVQIINDKKDMFNSGEESKESSNANMVLRFKIYNHNKLYPAESIELKQAYKVLFNKDDIVLDRDMLQYYSANKKQFKPEIVSNIETDIIQTILSNKN